MWLFPDEKITIAISHLLCQCNIVHRNSSAHTPQHFQPACLHCCSLCREGDCFPEIGMWWLRPTLVEVLLVWCMFSSACDAAFVKRISCDLRIKLLAAKTVLLFCCNISPLPCVCVDMPQNYTGLIGPVTIIHSLCLICRSVLAVTAEAWECWTPTGWVRTPPTSSLRWFWSTPSTRLWDATQTPNGSQRLCTSTERCVAWHLQERRAEAWARGTSSTWPSEAPAVQPGRGATPCSCAAIVRACHMSVHSRNKHPFYGDSPVWFIQPLEACHFSIFKWNRFLEGLDSSYTSV